MDDAALFEEAERQASGGTVVDDAELDGEEQGDGLFDEAVQERTRGISGRPDPGTLGPELEEPKIADVGTMLDIVRTEMAKLVAPARQVAEWERKQYRTRTLVVEWPVLGLSGQVTSAGMAERVQCSVRGPPGEGSMEASIRMSQMNGSWQVGKWAARLEERRVVQTHYGVNAQGKRDSNASVERVDRRQFLVLVVRWIDALGQQDLTYRNGIASDPLVVMQSSGLDPAMLTMLTKFAETQGGMQKAIENLSRILDPAVNGADGASVPFAAVAPKPRGRPPGSKNRDRTGETARYRAAKAERAAEKTAAEASAKG